MNKETKQRIADLGRLDPVEEATIQRAESDSGPLMQAILTGEVRTADPVLAVPPRRHRERRRGRGRGWRLVPAGIVAALVATAIVTTPGQAVAGWIGARLGIDREARPYGGHIGGAPGDVESLREASQGASPANGQRFVLLAQGGLPQNTHWQLSAFRPRPGSREASHPICFVVSLPEPGWYGGPGCATPRGPSVEIEPLHGEVWAGSVPGRTFSFADGVLGGDAAKVVVTSDGKHASVQLLTIPAGQLRRFGVRQPLKFFMARFWGNDAGAVVVKAYDRSGAMVARSPAVTAPHATASAGTQG